MVSRNEEAIPGEEYSSATAGTESHDWGRLKGRTSDGKIIRDSGRNVNARLTRWVVTRLQWEHFYIVERMSVPKNIRINQEDIC